MNNIDRQYQALLQDILDNGVQKGDRTGTGTISVFGRQIRHKMSEGFPLLTTKKMAWKTMVTELLWFLRGDTNIKYLVDNGCHIWDGDCYQAYLKGTERFGKKWQLDKEEFIKRIKTDDDFAKKWGELGPIYGKQWRKWTQYSVPEVTFSTGSYTAFRYEIDQIADAIHKLKTNPDDRGIIVSAWNVGELDQMVLRPCHNFFQFYTRELSLDERATLHPNPGMFYDIHGSFSIGDSMENSYIPDDVKGLITKEFGDAKVPTRAISLMWNQRSVDTFLGLPFNIASYALLLEIIAKEVNMIPDELIGNLGDVHLYSNHIEQAKEQIGREPMELPTLKHMAHLGSFSSWLFDKTYGVVLRPKDFIIENYQSHPSIKAPLSN